MLPVKMKPAVPVPDRVAVTALLLTLSTTVTAPVETPVVVGANVTFIVQDAFALSEAEQLFVWEKGPLTVMLMPRDAAKLFLRFSGWAAPVLPALVPPKVKLAGESVSGGVIPVPLKLTVCGLLVALSITLIEPVAAPAVVGLKETMIVQNAFALSEAEQLFVWEKGPLAEMFVMASVVPELSVNVRLWDGLVAPTIVFPKVMLAVESVAVICGDGGGLLLPPPQPLRITDSTAQDKWRNKLRI
jgi:hypothetical protein